MNDDTKVSPAEEFIDDPGYEFDISDDHKNLDRLNAIKNPISLATLLLQHSSQSSITDPGLRELLVQPAEIQ